MAQNSSFFNAIETSAGIFDRTYNATQWAQYFSSFIGNGVFANPSTNLQVNAGSNMQILINIGSAFINGYYYNNDSVITLALNEANGTYNRITNVVIELDLIGREITAKLIDGQAAPTPIAPELTRNGSTWQICIAQVTILAGSANIVASNIEDTRLINNLCGVVASTIQELDTTTLYQQWENGFSSWFANIKKEFSGSQVGGILTQLTNLQEKINQFPKNYLTNSEAKTILNQVTTLQEDVNQFSSEYLSITDNPTLTNPWQFSTVQINETGYFEFLNSNGNEIINFNVDDNTFYLTNNISAVNLMMITPTTVNKGLDTITWNAAFNCTEEVTVSELTNAGIMNYNAGSVINYNFPNMFTLQQEYNQTGLNLCNESTNNMIFNVIPSSTLGQDQVNINANMNISGSFESGIVNAHNALQINGVNLFNQILDQSGSISVQGNTIQYSITGWYVSNYLLTGGNADATAYFGVVGVNLVGENITLYNTGFNIPLSGTPFGTDLHLNTSMGVNVDNIATQATTTPFYISNIAPNSISIGLQNPSAGAYVGCTYIRTLITN